MRRIESAMFYPKLTFILAVLLVLAPATLSAPARGAGDSANATAVNAAPISVPFAFTNGKIVVQATINGTGPYPIGIDSGAETLMVTQAVADSAKLNVKTGTVEISGPTGNYTPVGQGQVDKLAISGIVVEKPFTTIAPRPLTDVDGYIGAPLFNFYVIQLDFGSHMLTAYPPGAYKPDPADIAIPIILGKHRVPVVKAAIGLLMANLEVDTGSGFPAELNPGFVKSNDLAGKWQQLGTVGTNSVNGPGTAGVFALPSLTIGADPAVNLGANMPTLFLPAGAPVMGDWDGRIGAPAWANWVITLDYPNAKMYLRPAVPVQSTPATSTPPAQTTQPPASTPANPSEGTNSPTSPAAPSPASGPSGPPPQPSK